jgi:SAM-dependent methyltransferase
VEPVSSNAPLPPAELAVRVGVVSREDALASFDAMGREAVAGLREFIPQPFTGRRMLDFGCGSGKYLRHLLPEAEQGEVWGCDIDEPSIAWLREHLSPPMRVFVNDAEPPLPSIPGAFFDLVTAASVFTHITDAWARWLVEIHRVLKPGGRLVASFLGNGMSELIADEPWYEDRIGMNVLRQWQGWEAGGPSVLHAPWWLRAHWGRAFELERITEAPQPGYHGIVVARKRDDGRAPTVAELEAPARDEPREVRALRHNLRQLEREAAQLAAERAHFAHLAHVREAEAQAAAATPPPPSREPALRRYADRAVERARDAASRVRR